MVVVVVVVIIFIIITIFMERPVEGWFSSGPTRRLEDNIKTYLS
jgi:hypothetical protein